MAAQQGPVITLYTCVNAAWQMFSCTAVVLQYLPTAQVAVASRQCLSCMVVVCLGPYLFSCCPALSLVAGHQRPEEIKRLLEEAKLGRMVAGAPGGAVLGAHMDGGMNDDTMIEDAIEVGHGSKRGYLIMQQA
jgi:hypothetical protein